MSIRPKAVNAQLTLDNDAIMSFSEDPIASSKSYIIRLPIDEIIRITCNNENLRNQYNLEDVSALSNVNLDYSVLFDNVRGFVTRSRYNKNISTTLEEEPSKFFMYNNGLTLIAENIEATSINANKRVKLELKSFQVINGGQTLRTIHRFHKLDRQNIVKYLSDSQVLVRIFKTTNNQTLNNKIAEYTNSQNSISSVDLKSLRPEQIDLEKYLDENKIVYSRKTGDTGLTSENPDREYNYQISMERFGQILYALAGNPHKASNRKNRIFDKDYDDIFGDKNLKIEDSPKQVRKYFDLKSLYEREAKENGYKVNDQKLFYILYLQDKTSQTIQDSKIIDDFEKALLEYRSDESELTSARKMIQFNFRKFVDEKFSTRS